MKRNFSVVVGALGAALLLLSTGRTVAQNAKPPTQLTYQGFLTDGNGLPFGNTTPTNKTVIFRIYDKLSSTDSSQKLIWSSQQVVTVDKGYFSVLLGQGSAVGSEPFNADLTGVFTGAATVSDRYLELNADGTTIAPRLRFLPAPYAMLAKSATELLDPVTGASFLSSGSGNITANGNLGGYSLYAAYAITSHAQQGVYLEWNKDGGNGMSYFLNQRGTGGGGLVFGEVSPTNTITERMRIDGSGNVGIGTSTPGGKLEVRAEYNQSPLLVLKQNTASWGSDTIFNSYRYITTTGGDTASSQKQFNVGAGGVSIGYSTVPIYGSSDALYVNGNVGLGTSAPVGRLNISEANGTVATANAGSIVLDHGNSGGSSSILFRSTSNRGSDYGYINYQDNSAGSVSGGENAVLTIGTQNDGDDHIALMPSGNVGIGTSSPAVKLDVAGNGRFNANTGIGLVNQGFYGDSDNIALRPSAAGATFFQNYAGTTTYMFVANNGNVGIGNSSQAPAARLQVTGSGTPLAVETFAYFDSTFKNTSIQQNSANNWAYSILADGRIGAAGFHARSDARIKVIVGVSDRASDLATLRRIEVTDYRLKDTVANGGATLKKVIAQQVEGVFPQAVSKSTDVVPDIFCQATAKAGWVQLATDLRVGERVRLIGRKETGIHEVREVRDGAFRTDFVPADNQVFVYGREVKDFRSVDYDAIAMLNVSATQELAAKQQELGTQMEALRRSEARIAELEQKVGKLSELERELAEMKKLLARLAGARNGERADNASTEDVKVVARR